MAEFRRLPSLTQLRHLIALDDHRHFGRAAEACFVTQSSLSASIKELEVTLGREIVERTKRHVLPTPLGEAVIARARDIVIAAEDLVDMVAAAQGPLAGALRLGVIPTISPFLLPRVLPALRRAHPELRLYLREAETAALLDLLRRGEIDAMLMAFPYDRGALERWEFAIDTLWVALPANHPLARQERIGPADLTGEELLLLEEGHCLREHALAAFGARRPATTTHATSLATLVQMVANGIGLTLLPKMAIDGGLLRGTRLQARPLDGPAAERRIGLAWRSSSPRGDAFRLLGGYFRDELATPVPARHTR